MQAYSTGIQSGYALESAVCGSADRQASSVLFDSPFSGIVQPDRRIPALALLALVPYIVAVFAV
jgi:hypothetical protein